MDTLAILLAMCAFAVFEADRERHGVLIGLLAVSALLVTPRVAILLCPLFMVSSARLLRSGSRRPALATLVVVAGAYLCWVGWAFGGPAGAVRFYRQFPREIAAHIVVPWYQLALIAAAVGLQAWRAWNRSVSDSTELRIVGFGSMLLFYSIVHEFWGGYSIYLLPFYYLLLADGLAAVPRRVAVTLVTVLLAVNAAVFAVHGRRTVTALPTHDAWTRAAAAIHHAIPSGSRVISDGSNLIVLLNNQNDVESLSYDLVEDNFREHYNREVFDYQYVLVTDRFVKERPDLLPLYTSHATLVRVADFIDLNYGFVVYRRLE
jgi:hypothetical protein